MQLRDIVNVTTNKNNKQINLSLKKKKIKDLDLSEESILNIKLNLKKMKLKGF
jgi:hypothetical protein